MAKKTAKKTKSAEPENGPVTEKHAMPRPRRIGDPPVVEGAPVLGYQRTLQNRHIPPPMHTAQVRRIPRQEATVDERQIKELKLMHELQRRARENLTLSPMEKAIRRAQAVSGQNVPTQEAVPVPVGIGEPKKPVQE